MIKKPLSCKLRPSDINTDLECLLLSEVGSYEKIIKELLYDIHEEFSGDWNEIWSFDDVIDRFDKGEILWLALKDDKPISCSWISIKSDENLFIYNTWLKPKLRGTGLFKKISLVRNDKLYNLGYEKLLCVTDNVRAEWGLKKIGYKEDNWLNIHYTFWTGGYDSTFYVCKLLTEGKIVQPIYIDDRVSHGGDTYPRKCTEIELEKLDSLRDKIYDRIPSSKELLLSTIVIDEPIEEDEEISRVVERYNEWIPNTVYKNKHGENKWLPVQTDILLRFQKQFGLKIEFPIEHIEGEWYEIIDDAMVDGNLDVSKLPEEHKDLEVLGGFIYPIRDLYKEDMLEIAKKDGYEELLYYTWSCWYPIDGKPCNKCKLCKDRIIECRN